MLVGLVFGIAIGGPIGVLVATYSVCWVIWKFPNVIQSWNNTEKHNPDTKKYRMDKW